MVPGWLNPSRAPQAQSETLRTPKRYSLHLYLGRLWPSDDYDEDDDGLLSVPHHEQSADALIVSMPVLLVDD